MSKRLIHLIASNVWGGSERYALDICSYFADKGWSVTAYTRDARAVDDLFLDASIDIRHAPLQGLVDPWSVNLLASDLRSERRATVIHAHRYRDAMMAAIARMIAGRSDIAIVTTRHSAVPARHPRLLRAGYSSVDAHIFLSNFSRNVFVESFGDCSPFDMKRTYIIGNSAPWPQNSIPAEEPQKGPVIAMYHGRIMPGKGLETLLYAMKEVRDLKLRLRIVGRGNPDYVDNIRRLAISLGVNDKIDWYRYSADPQFLIERAHFGVTPSVVAEAYGQSNVEYMMMGRPVVTSSSGAQEEYITHGVEGLIVPAGDAMALAAAMRALVVDKGLRRTMGEKALKAYNATMSRDHTSAAIERVYAEAVALREASLKGAKNFL